MTIEITMPRLSDTMEEGTLLHWHVQVGDVVGVGDVIADIETDKATMELQSFDDGTISEVLAKEGEKVAVGKIIAMLREEDEELIPETTPPDIAPPPPTTDHSGMTISPVARRLADEFDVDLKTIQGSGPSGRVIKRDILQVVEATKETSAAATTTKPDDSIQHVVSETEFVTTSQPIVPIGSWRENRSVPLSNMRQIIAKRLVESKQSIPHYQVTMTFDMDPLLDMRKTLNKQLLSSGVKLSVVVHWRWNNTLHLMRLSEAIVFTTMARSMLELPLHFPKSRVVDWLWGRSVTLIKKVCVQLVKSRAISLKKRERRACR